MKKTSKGQTTGAGNPGWGDSENLEATRPLHSSDDAPTTVFSSDETAVLSDYQDPTEVLNARETATPAAGHSDDRTKVLTDYGSSQANEATSAGSANAESANTEVISSHPEHTEVIGATRPLPRAYRAPIKIPETIPSPQERASQGNYGADEPMQATRRLDPPKPPVSGFPLNNQMGASPMGAQQPLPPQALPQPVAYPPEAYPAAAYPNGAYVQTGQVPVDASGRPVDRPGEEQGHHLPSTGVLMRHVMALLFLGLTLYGAFVFFIYTATGQ